MEQVVLLDESGNSLGAAEKASAHHRQTPLHLAFSCYVYNSAGEFLLTRRAEGKRVFPGVWTNSCCGHPAPGEPITDAVDRRVRQELGITLGSTTLVLPRFRYQAEMDGVVENEWCPVFAGFTDGPIDPDPEEVADAEWLPWPDFLHRVNGGELRVSPWCAMQLADLTALGPDPLSWPAADPAGLPPAARG